MQKFMLQQTLLRSDHTSCINILSRICQIFRLFVYSFEFAGLRQDAQQTLEGAVHELPEDAEARLCIDVFAEILGK